MNWLRLAILAVILYACVGCAVIPTVEQCAATKFPTEEQLTQCIKDAKEEADRQYEREDRRTKEVDRIVWLYNACEASDKMVFLNARNLSRHDLNKLRRVKGRITHDDVPHRLRASEIKCVDEVRIVE
jgi:hypothetical protein